MNAKDVVEGLTYIAEIKGDKRTLKLVWIETESKRDGLRRHTRYHVTDIHSGATFLLHNCFCFKHEVELDDPIADPLFTTRTSFRSAVFDRPVVMSPKDLGTEFRYLAWLRLEAFLGRVQAGEFTTVEAALDALFGQPSAEPELEFSLPADTIRP